MGRAEEKDHAEDSKRQAIEFKLRHKTKDAPQVTSRCARLGSAYGVGIGLYFQTIAWVRALLLWLALAAVPFMVIINTSQFTTAEQKGKLDGAGVAVLPSFNPLQSWTFAAMMDDSRDSGILAWLNIRLPGIAGVFTMTRPYFLKLISVLDACSMAVFSVVCMLLYKMAARFVKAVDDATMEVADYTVVVKGLPTETTPQEIGQHFRKFGKVMDVVMVKDFGPLLSLAAEATALKEQHSQAKERSERGHNAAAYQRQVAATEKKLAKFYDAASKQLDDGLELKAVFVTFNSQVERAECQAQCPKRWISSFLQPRQERFGDGQHRFWVEQAKPPEDYIYENLHYSRLARYIRSALVILLVLAILLISAAAVTKLMAINISSSRHLAWSDVDIRNRIDAAMLHSPLNATQVSKAAAAASSALTHISDVIGEPAAATLTESAAVNRLGYCSVMLQETCSEQLSILLRTQVNMQPAQKVQWANLADSFLKAKDFYSELQAWMDTDASSGYEMCYPCYCHMLSAVAAANEGDSEWVYSTRKECSAFINVDVRGYAMKALVSGVLVLLNIVLKQALQLLVSFEKHWTKSDQERQYAVMAFVSQLLNSVLVLLLVNARSSSASAIINNTLGSDQRTKWGTNVILSGAFTDFVPGWYIDVGQSLEIIIILNAVLTVVFAWGLWVYRKLRQGCLMNCVVTANQRVYNSAWVGDSFVLDYRVSDMMLGIWIILMFGSGMPGIYIYGIVWLVALDITDRWYLTVMCQHPVRYGKNLPYLVLGVLPWAAATHCAFGLWMHTRFYAGEIQSLSDLTNRASGGIASLAETDIGHRITQLNGLPLLILLICHVTMHGLIRFMIYCFSGKAFKSCSDEGDSDEPEIEITYESALLSTYNKKASSDRKLAGTPTYRLPHHPRYQDMFGDNAAYKPLWFKAFGRDRYTQLVSRPGGGFRITAEPVLLHDETEVQQLLEGLGEKAQTMARKLTETDKGGAMRERSKSVNVTVMAGLAPDSPRAGDPRGIPASRGQRHSVMGPVTGLGTGSFVHGHGVSFVAAADAARLASRFAEFVPRTSSSGPSFTAAAHPPDMTTSPDGIIFTADSDCLYDMSTAGLGYLPYGVADGRTRTVPRMSAMLPHTNASSDPSLPVIPVMAASAASDHGWYAANTSSTHPEITVADQGPWPGQYARLSQHHMSAPLAGVQLQAVNAISGELLPAVPPDAAGLVTYPAMLQGGYFPAEPVATAAAVAPAGWDMPVMTGAAISSGNPGFGVPGQFALHSTVDADVLGHSLWGPAAAAAAAASEQNTPVSLTPYAAAARSEPLTWPSGANTCNERPATPVTAVVGSVFGGSTTFSPLSVGIVGQEPDPAYYPNVHLTTVELPAAHQQLLANSPPGAVVVPNTQSKPDGSGNAVDHTQSAAAPSQQLKAEVDMAGAQHGLVADLIPVQPASYVEAAAGSMCTGVQDGQNKHPMCMTAEINSPKETVGGISSTSYTQSPPIVACFSIQAATGWEQPAQLHDSSTAMAQAVGAGEAVQCHWQAPAAVAEVPADTEATQHQIKLVSVALSTVEQQQLQQIADTASMVEQRVESDPDSSSDDEAGLPPGQVLATVHAAADNRQGPKRKRKKHKKGRKGKKA